MNILTFSGLACVGMSCLHAPAGTIVYDLADSFEPCNDPCYIHFTLIGTTENGLRVSNAHLQVTFKTFGLFNSSDVFLELTGPIVQGDGSTGATWLRTGADLGWSGQGTFSAMVDSDVLNGAVAPTFWQLHVGEPGHVFQGDYIQLRYVIDLEPIPPGDANGDGVVNIDDLLLVINSWGLCQPPPSICPGDLNNTGATDVDDLLLVINNWG
jgi:hypothetical protein